MKRRRGLGTALGRVLRRARTGATLSQERLAFLSGLHPTYISQLERGIKSPTVDALWNIAKALNIPVSVILKTVEDEV